MEALLITALGLEGYKRKDPLRRSSSGEAQSRKRNSRPKDVPPETSAREADVTLNGDSAPNNRRCEAYVDANQGVQATHLSNDSPADESPDDSSKTEAEREAELRDQRKDKSEKEKGRRHHLNVLYNELANLMGIAGQNKTQILVSAREFLRQNTSLNAQGPGSKKEQRKNRRSDVDG